MAVEQAQHLIAMSLGKIAASRNQRGGANLHRSLLVSTVLHKARTTIMMENFQAMMQQRRAQMEAQQQRVEVADERPATPLPVSVSAEHCWDKENSPPATPVPTAMEPCDRLSGVAEIKEQDNNNNSCALSSATSHCNNNTLAERPTPLQESNSENVSPNCAKCLKRRVTELGPSDDYFISSKRTKYESDSELSHDANSRSDCAFDSENVDYSSSPCESQTPEPMQTDPVQITNLVNRFNTGLSGLLTHVANEQQHQQHGQCGSEQAFTSCCTQVKDSGIESLSRPCIALTV